MDFAEVLEQVLELLQRQGRVTYGALKRRFTLDDDYLQDLKDELLFAHAEHVKEEGPGLVWVQEQGAGSREQRAEGERVKQGNGEEDVVGAQSSVVSPQHPTPNTQHPSAERRQLTVMFCDLVGSTALSTRLDPEDLRQVVQQYQQTCAEVIQRHEGHIAQYLGDGLLVYFGYPTAHEDDARRAVRTGLEIVDALRHQVLSSRQGEGQGEVHLQVRIGIHTGLVVIGDIGGTGRTEQLALGETPNIAARIQGLAEPNTVIISAATQRLIEGQFENQPFGSHLVKGIDTPIAVYHVQSERQSASPLAGRTSLTPLVGREQEIGLLIDRWEQAKEGQGQVVLLSGEPGIGKSRLAYTLREHVTAEGSLLFEARCSLYHQHSAFYPLIDVLQRTLLLNRQDTDSEKVDKLERALALYSLPDSLPLFTALLSLPTPAQYPPLNVTPQKQKERTLQALVQLLMAQAERQATVSVWEDLHWADPSSLEFLSLLIEQIPTTNLLLVLTFRPEFVPPWKPRSHISQLVLNRLGKKQVEVMIEQAAGRQLSSEVIEQIRMKTDGVPLFVEELTKSVVESVGATGRSPLQTLAIPATLQEALLARLDRLSTARQVAQLGATLGREFSHELIQAVTPISEEDLHFALAKLVEAEILYQRGIGEQARYFFKHALIQDTAYQSLLKSTRQQYHRQIAQVLEERFLQTKDTQPELLAHHYTEAGLIEQAIQYWQQAGLLAVQRSANTEAIRHFTKGLECLQTLSVTPEHVRQELALQIALVGPLTATRGYAAPEVEKLYSRARELCRQIGETPHLWQVLLGLFSFHIVRMECKTALELAKQCFTLAQGVQEQPLLIEAHRALGQCLYLMGEFVSAKEHLEQSVVLYGSQPRRAAGFFWTDPGVVSHSWGALNLCLLGYPDQALQRAYEAVTLAQKLSHMYTLATALGRLAMLHHLRQESRAMETRAEETIALATEHGFPFFSMQSSVLKGWTQAHQGQVERGIAQMCHGMRVLHDMGVESTRPYHLVLLAEIYWNAGQATEGLAVLAEALDLINNSGEHFYEAEVYRLKGELTLQSSVQILEPGGKKAEEYFLKAIEIAQKQQAKSLELRAAMSLARLRQQQALGQRAENETARKREGAEAGRPEGRSSLPASQLSSGKLAEAHKLLSDVYNWFTEGFDTKDLQEAKALLADLAT